MPGHVNASNVYRISKIIPAGTFGDLNGLPIDQSCRYYRAVGDADGISSKWKARTVIYTIEQQIKQIVHDICVTLSGAYDELFFFGAGRGAFVVRAVAGVLHHMGLPKQSSMRIFDDIYQQALDLLKFRFLEDGRQGEKCIRYLKEHCGTPPNTQFIGVFDTVRHNGAQNKHDLSFLRSQYNIRQALAFNESRSAYLPEVYQTPGEVEMKGRTLIQAWFVGAHADMVGGSQHDGLSLYPLQWIIIEAIEAGLTVRSDAKEVEKDSSLALAFPHFQGQAPTLGSGEQIEWNMPYSNGISVIMYDLASLHSKSDSDKDSSTHTVRINDQSALISSSRKAFQNRVTLIGWQPAAAYGTIIHPSLYCVMDRYPRISEQARFKDAKEELATFQENNMKDNDAPVPPWLADMQLQASGVKAFRILVCGKTGVGKSTLINKVFGVEMTEESNTYAQGVHDINKAFESTNHPGLLIHDSRGWQAGSDRELELIAKFLRHRAFQKDPAEALHVIW